MIQRSIVVAEDLKNDLVLRSTAQDFSRFLHEDLRLFSAGAPAEEILKASQTWPRPEMIIMSAPGHQEVLLKSERPVMVLGPKAQEKFLSLKSHKPRRILISTDLTRASRPAEHYALSLAARLDAEVVLFHSVFDHIQRVHNASIVSGFASFDMERIFQKMTRDAQMLLERKRRRFLKIVGRCDIKIAENGRNISESLLRESARNYCLVVMGTHSRRNALVRAFLGSTAQDTIARSDIPIVVVHSH